MNITKVGEGKVELLAGGGKIFTDVATRFIRTEKDLDDIIASEKDIKLINKIMECGHTAMTEFDYFIFAVSGYSRVTEVQLVRKRVGTSYAIKSGRVDKKGKRNFDIVMPDNRPMSDLSVTKELDLDKLVIVDEKGDKCEVPSNHRAYLRYDSEDILNMIEAWYNRGVESGVAEEDLRYIKPQATEFKALIGMSARSLNDFFKVRLCLNAQKEIRDMAIKMYSKCNEVAPELFKHMGPNCKVLGYCPENSMQNKACKGKIMTHLEVKELIEQHTSIINNI